MKAHDVKSHAIITISQDTHRQLLNIPFAQSAESHAVINTNGTVSFPVRPALKATLQDIHPDPDRAIQILLGSKTN